MNGLAWYCLYYSCPYHYHVYGHLACLLILTLILRALCFLLYFHNFLPRTRQISPALNVRTQWATLIIWANSFTKLIPTRMVKHDRKSDPEKALKMALNLSWTYSIKVHSDASIDWRLLNINYFENKLALCAYQMVQPLSKAPWFKDRVNRTRKSSFTSWSVNQNRPALLNCNKFCGALS